VYSKEAGLTLPQLLPLDLPIPTDIKCQKKIDGIVELSLLVDASGRGRNIMFVRPLGSDVDRYALRIAGGADRFTPGSLNGNPVVVATSLRMKIQSCLVKSQDGTGEAPYILALRSNPVQKLTPATDRPDRAVLTSDTFEWSDKDSESPKTESLDVYKGSLVGDAVHAPKPLIEPKAEYTEEARKAKIEGTCLISMIVDSQGMPRNVQVKKSLNPGLDQNALIAVGKYRFKPAMKNGEPVSVYVNMEVHFRL
jgi:TonB family protein